MELQRKLFINYLRTERSLSENTISAYNADLEKFLPYLRDVCLIDEIKKVTEDHIHQFLNYLDKSRNRQEKKYSGKSVSRYISSLKTFFKYLEAEKVIEANPVENIETPKTSRMLPEVLSIEEIERLLCQQDLSDKLELRDRAILETMYASGLRVSEVTDLEISNIFFEEGFIRVFGKGSKERIVPVGRTALKVIIKYIKESRSELKNNRSHNYLFLNFRGGRLSRMAILDIVRKYCSLAGIKKNVHPHTIRHSFATHLLQGGADIRIIQEMLGHSDISTTQIYTHVDMDYLIEVHKTFHPRA